MSDYTAPEPAGDLPDQRSFDEAREIIRSTGLGTALAQTVLMELELAGRVQRLPGNRAVLAE